MGFKKKLFCFGYGYTCDYLGHELLSREGWSVAGTTRSPEKKEILRARGVQAHVFDYEAPLVDPLYLLEGTTHLLISTPPDDEGDPTFSVHGQDILNLKSLEWVGYLSTTGVYGNRDGCWVDERSEPCPTSQRGSRRLRAEEQWLSLFKAHGVPVHVFRLSGIYGPGRSAIDSLRAGMTRRIYKPGHTFGRIHVEDIVGALLASVEAPQPGQVYNVTDDMPAPSHEVIEYAAKLLGVEVPQLVDFENAGLAPITRSFYMDNRKTSNEKIKRVLEYAFKYPTYKEGLKGCLEAEKHALSQVQKTMPSVFTPLAPDIMRDKEDIPS